VFVFVNFATTVVNCRQINDNLRALLDGEGGVSDNSLVQDGSNAMSMIGKPANDDRKTLRRFRRPVSGGILRRKTTTIRLLRAFCIPFKQMIKTEMSFIMAAMIDQTKILA